MNIMTEKEVPFGHSKFNDGSDKEKSQYADMHCMPT